ncbi:MAG: prolyl oligopeptidase family serine peptidase [Pseudomonadota bacterium]
MIRALVSSGLVVICAACSTLQDDPMTETASLTDSVPDSFKGPGEHHIWLEDVEGDAALDWVRTQNARSLASLEGKPVYAENLADALDALTSNERIPYGSVRDGMVYNFWQDEQNVRGLWRRTPLESYSSDAPAWETLLDFDALAEAEGANWVFKGANCAKPGGSERWLCMISLSDGGKDAVIQREFDIEAKAFVGGGFETPEAKQGFAWVDANTALIATDWGDGTLTESGYPFIVKRWTRGTALSDAIEVKRGDVSDVGVWPFTVERNDGARLQGVVESDTFFTSTYWLLPEGSEPVALPIPPRSDVEELYGEHLLVTLKEDWSPEGQDDTFPSGSVVAFDLGAFLSDGTMPAVEAVFAPTDRQAVNGVAVARGEALLSFQEDVVGRIARLDRTEDGWIVDSLELPGAGQAGIAFASRHEETVFLNYEGFLTPDSLLDYSTDTGAVETLKSLPAKFDSNDLTVEQFFATSADGTQIPYFVVRKADTVMDGSTPTLLYGYGGFEIPLNPSYSATVGRLWLEKGGAYVLANIRGGGEYGPRWHQAGLKTDRQRIYDDFIAVGEAIIETGLTTPDRLGIMGGSNGGLLMGVMLNQRPDLWNAVVVQVPLLDMLRYHTLLAGASWVDEYGSPEIAEERAFLETISPYHNFDPEADYPVPFFVTSTKDDRVHPGHARKMAKLFEDSGKPFLYYENIDGGHSAAANQTARAKRSALEFTYLYDRLFDTAED